MIGILILDNDFTSEEGISEAYISTGHDLFHSQGFYALKANEKLLAMYILKITGANRGKYCVGVIKLYHIFTKMLGVTKRAIQNYLKNLKKFFLAELVIASIGLHHARKFIKQMLLQIKSCSLGE